MSKRLNQEREKKLEPLRLASCKKKLESLGFEVEQCSSKLLTINLDGNFIHFWPYSGWFTGKGVKDGRGFKNLIKQII